MEELSKIIQQLNEGNNWDLSHLPINNLTNEKIENIIRCYEIKVFSTILMEIEKSFPLLDKEKITIEINDLIKKFILDFSDEIFLNKFINIKEDFKINQKPIIIDSQLSEMSHLLIDTHAINFKDKKARNHIDDYAKKGIDFNDVYVINNNFKDMIIEPLSYWLNVDNYFKIIEDYSVRDKEFDLYCVRIVKSNYHVFQQSFVSFYVEKAQKHPLNKSFASELEKLIFNSLNKVYSLSEINEKMNDFNREQNQDLEKFIELYAKGVTVGILESLSYGYVKNNFADVFAAAIDKNFIENNKDKDFFRLQTFEIKQENKFLNYYHQITPSFLKLISKKLPETLFKSIFKKAVLNFLQYDYSIETWQKINEAVPLKVLDWNEEHQGAPLFFRISNVKLLSLINQQQKLQIDKKCDKISSFKSFYIEYLIDESNKNKNNENKKIIVVDYLKNIEVSPEVNIETVSHLLTNSEFIKVFTKQKNHQVNLLEEKSVSLLKDNKYTAYIKILESIQPFLMKEEFQSIMLNNYLLLESTAFLYGKQDVQRMKALNLTFDHLTNEQKDKIPLFLLQKKTDSYSSSFEITHEKYLSYLSKKNKKLIDVFQEPQLVDNFIEDLTKKEKTLKNYQFLKVLYDKKYLTYENIKNILAKNIENYGIVLNKAIQEIEILNRSPIYQLLMNVIKKEGFFNEEKINHYIYDYKENVLHEKKMEKNDVKQFIQNLNKQVNILEGSIVSFKSFINQNEKFINLSSIEKNEMEIFSKAFNAIDIMNHFRNSSVIDNSELKIMIDNYNINNSLNLIDEEKSVKKRKL